MAIPKKLKAATAIAQRSRMDLRMACRAVTGPWTAEYEPAAAGKRKMPRTQTIATMANSCPKWRVMAVSFHYKRTHLVVMRVNRFGVVTKVVTLYELRRAARLRFKQLEARQQFLP